MRVGRFIGFRFQSRKSNGEILAAIRAISQMSRHVRSLSLEEGTFCKCGEQIGVRVAVRLRDRLLP